MDTWRRDGHCRGDRGRIRSGRRKARRGRQRRMSRRAGPTGWRRFGRPGPHAGDMGRVHRWRLLRTSARKRFVTRLRLLLLLRLPFARLHAIVRLPLRLLAVITPEQGRLHLRRTHSLCCGRLPFCACLPRETSGPTLWRQHGPNLCVRRACVYCTVRSCDLSTGIFGWHALASARLCLVANTRRGGRRGGCRRVDGAVRRVGRHARWPGQQRSRGQCGRKRRWSQAACRWRG